MAIIFKDVLLCLIINFLLNKSVSGLMPLKCLANLTAIISMKQSSDVSKEIVCCLIPPGHNTPCGYPQRGSCQLYQDSYKRNIPPYPFNLDIRQEWPKRFIQRMCICNFPYHGADCGECWYGWTGPKCDQRVLRIRRDIHTYSSDEKKLFQDVLLRMHERSSEMVILVENVPPGLSIDASTLEKPGQWIPATMHEALVFIHYFTQRQLLTHNMVFCRQTISWKHLTDYNHQGPGFMPWHRHFINLWERWAEKVAQDEFGVHNFTFPYWDWTNKEECEVCTEDLVGRTSTPLEKLENDQLGEGSPFRNWTVICPRVISGHACAPCHAGPRKPLRRSWRHTKFPTSLEVSSTIEQEHYDMYEEYDKDRFHHPQLSDILGEVETERCGAFAFRLEGVCPNVVNGIEQNDKERTLFMHNRVHNMCNGTFFSGRTSPNDPFFILHHTQMDRIFQAWIRRRGNITADEMPEEEWHVGQCRQCPMVGFFPPIGHARMFADSRELGYDYENYRFANLNYGTNS